MVEVGTAAPGGEGGAVVGAGHKRPGCIARVGGGAVEVGECPPLKPPHRVDTKHTLLLQAPHPNFRDHKVLGQERTLHPRLDWEPPRPAWELLSDPGPPVGMAAKSVVVGEPEDLEPLGSWG